jgi:hypothetical protein
MGGEPAREDEDRRREAHPLPRSLLSRKERV